MPCPQLTRLRRMLVSGGIMRLNGLTVFWHYNGSMAAKGEFKNDLRHGAWKWWNDQGVLIKDGQFLDGLPHGKVIDYDDGGNVIYEAYYLNGVEISNGPPLREALRHAG